MSKKTSERKGWKVQKQTENQALVTLPEGFKFTSSDVDIEDILEAIQRHGVLSKGDVGDEGDTVVVKCCGGNTALA